MNHTLKEATCATKKPWSNLDIEVFTFQILQKKQDEPCVFPGMDPEMQLYLEAGGGGISKAKDQSGAVTVNFSIM